ncbi:hypothetical protein VTN96DRAFT_4390 [Rasamsonia emersonii]
MFRPARGAWLKALLASMNLVSGRSARSPEGTVTLDGHVNANGLSLISQDGSETVAAVEHSLDLGSLSSAAATATTTPPDRLSTLSVQPALLQETLDGFDISLSLPDDIPSLFETSREENQNQNPLPTLEPTYEGEPSGASDSLADHLPFDNVIPNPMNGNSLPLNYSNLVTYGVGISRLPPHPTVEQLIEFTRNYPRQMLDVDYWSPFVHHAARAGAWQNRWPSRSLASQPSTVASRTRRVLSTSWENRRRPG